MPIVYTQQHRPITVVQTAESDGLSSLYYRDTARNANVCKGRSNPRHVLNVGFYPPDVVTTHAAPGEEEVLFQARVPARLGFVNCTVNLWAALDKAGNAVVVHFYSDVQPYIGPALPVGGFNPATELSSAYDGSQTCAITVANIAPAYEWKPVGTLPIARTSIHDSYIIATMKIGGGGAPPHLVFGSCEIWYEELS